jgi:hypothetical protein
MSRVLPHALMVGASLLLGPSLLLLGASLLLAASLLLLPVVSASSLVEPVIPGTHASPSELASVEQLSPASSVPSRGGLCWPGVGSQ